MEKGAMYIATDRDFLEEALISIKSLKKQNNLPVTVITDLEVDSELVDNVIEPEEVRSEESDKVYNIGLSPYEKTIFLDTDTYIVDNLQPLFEVLEKYDVAMTHNPERKSQAVEGVPDSFPELNTGVISFKANQKTENLFKNWKKQYVGRNYESHKDQPAFRKALFKTDIKHTVLPSEYNCRHALPGFLNEKAKIFHGRLKDIESQGFRYHIDHEKAAEKLNSKQGTRLHYVKRNKLKLIGNNPKPWDVLITALRWYGVKNTTKKLICNLKEKQKTKTKGSK